MKTVIDAVNKFKGIWNDCPVICNHTQQTIIWECLDKGTDSGYIFGQIVIGLASYDINIYKRICNELEFNQCVDEMSKAEWIKPVTAPTFTQGMADAGTLPSVGMKVGFLKEVCTYTVMLGADKEGDLILSPDDGDYWQRAHKSDIKALTPPIELEEQGLYLFDADKNTKIVGQAYWSEWSSGGDWMINCLRTNYNFHASRCTNIQLLEVKS